MRENSVALLGFWVGGQTSQKPEVAVVPWCTRARDRNATSSEGSGPRCGAERRGCTAGTGGGRYGRAQAVDEQQRQQGRRRVRRRRRRLR